MKLKNIVAGAALTLLAATSCSSPENIAYMQNARSGQEQTILNACEIKVQPLDQLTIVVSCKEPELAALFNLVETNKRLSGGGNGASTSSAGNVSAYTVDSEGNIDFPILEGTYSRIHPAANLREGAAPAHRRQLGGRPRGDGGVCQPALLGARRGGLTRHLSHHQRPDDAARGYLQGRRPHRARPAQHHGGA